MGKDNDHHVEVRRVYDEPTDQDGLRVLVDGIWPRGVSKSKAQLDEWCKEVAPSTALRQWYGHDQSKFVEFSRRYRLELTEPNRAAALLHLTGLADAHQLTLLTGTKRPEISQAAVLADLLGRARVLPLTTRQIPAPPQNATSARVEPAPDRKAGS